MEASLENINSQLELMSRRQIAARASILNMLLLVFFLKKKATGRRSAVTRFVSGTKVVPVENSVTNENELQCLDAAISTCSGTEKHEFIQKKLQTMEASLENINSQLELIFRKSSNGCTLIDIANEMARVCHTGKPTWLTWHKVLMDEELVTKLGEGHGERLHLIHADEPNLQLLTCSSIIMGDAL
nr:hypothetical protein [Tanacetum cinerariifolium]